MRAFRFGQGLQSVDFVSEQLWCDAHEGEFDMSGWAARLYRELEKLKKNASKLVEEMDLVPFIALDFEKAADQFAEQYESSWSLSINSRQRASLEESDPEVRYENETQFLAGSPVCGDFKIAMEKAAEK